MSKSTKPSRSNDDRGLMRHVDPQDPEGPMLKSLPAKRHGEDGTAGAVAKPTRKPPAKRQASPRNKRS